jgi:hypothetical protein
MKNIVTKVMISDLQNILNKIAKKAKWVDGTYANDWDGVKEELKYQTSEMIYIYLFYTENLLYWGEDLPFLGTKTEVDNDKFIKLVTLDYCFSLLEEIL